MIWAASLTADKCVHSIDGRNTGLDEVTRIDTGVWIDRTSVYIYLLVADDFRIAVDRLSKSIENTSKKTFSYTEFHRILKEFHGGAFKVKSCRTTKNLNYRSILVEVDDSSGTFFTKFITNIYNFVKRGIFTALNNYNRSVYRFKTCVFNTFQLEPLPAVHALKFRHLVIKMASYRLEHVQFVIWNGAFCTHNLVAHRKLGNFHQRTSILYHLKGMGIEIHDEKKNVQLLFRN